MLRNQAERLVRGRQWLAGWWKTLSS
jgi:hypothetical protein